MTHLGLVSIIPGIAGLCKVTTNGLALLLRLHPEQIDRWFQKLETAQLICIQPAILKKTTLNVNTFWGISVICNCLFDFLMWSTRWKFLVRHPFCMVSNPHLLCFKSKGWHNQKVFMNIKIMDHIHIHKKVSFKEELYTSVTDICIKQHLVRSTKVELRTRFKLNCNKI